MCVVTSLVLCLGAVGVFEDPVTVHSMLNAICGHLC